MVAGAIAKPAGVTLREAYLAVRIPSAEPFEAVILTLEFREEGDKFLGECLELGTAAYGDSFGEARAQLVENVTLQLNEVEQMGFMDDYLSEHGLRLLTVPLPRSKKPRTPSWVMPLVTG